jgi:hypothetical protein
MVKDAFVNEPELGAGGVIPPDDRDALNAFIEEDGTDGIVPDIPTELKAVSRLRLKSAAQLVQVRDLWLVNRFHFAIQGSLSTNY